MAISLRLECFFPILTHLHSFSSVFSETPSTLKGRVNYRKSILTLGGAAKHTTLDIPIFISKPTMCGRELSSSKAPVCFRTQEPLSDKIIKDKIFYLRSIGVDYRKSFAGNPPIESVSLENIQIVVNYLQGMGFTTKDVGRIFVMLPEVMSLIPDEDLRPVFNFLLKEVKISQIDIPKAIMKCPRLLTCSVKDQLRPTLYYLVRLGFKDMHLPSCQNSYLLSSNVEKKFIPKIEYMQSMGLSYREAVKISRRFPAIFGYSIAGNLEPKIEYLVHEMDRSIDDLKEFPQYFAFSLEKRIKPRHAFLSQKNIQLPLSEMLITNDEDFYCKWQGRTPVEALPV